MKWMRCGITLLGLLVLAFPAFSSEDNKVAICLGYGAFVPTNSAVRDTYSSSWERLGITTFQPVLPKEWRFTAETGSLKVGGPTSVSLLPITAGIQRGFTDKWSLQPYAALRTGPCYGVVKTSATGDKDSSIGWNANAAFGLIYKRRYYIETRYDYFTEFGDSNFSGLSFSIGTRLFDIHL